MKATVHGLIVAEEVFASCGPIRMALLAGARSDETRIRTLLAGTTDLPVGLRHRDTAAAVHRACHQTGVTIRSQIDCPIATVALDYAMPVLHLDRDYPAIRAVMPELEFDGGLRTAHSCWVRRSALGPVRRSKPHGEAAYDEELAEQPVVMTIRAARALLDEAFAERVRQGWA